MIVLCLIVSLATFETKANLISQVGHIKPWPTLAPGWRMARRPPCLEPMERRCGPICCFFIEERYEPPTPKPKKLECYQGDRGEPCGPRCCKRDEVCKRVNYIRL